MSDIVVAFSAECPPLSVIVAARVSGISLTPDPSLPPSSAAFFRFPSGLTLQGRNTLLRYLGRVSELPNFYGKDALDSAQIDEWLEYAPIFSSGSQFESACMYVDSYLALRTFLVGYSLSIADIAIWSGLAGIGQRWESLKKSRKYQNLVRWFSSITEDYSFLNEVTGTYVGKRGLGKSPSINPTQTFKANEKPVVNCELNSREKAPPFEVDLPGAKVGEVCLRFAPEPSGFLHIGHTKAALLNQYFAQKYQGRMIIRFDDTNPSKESSEFVENLLRDIETLGIKYDAVTYTSDYFSRLMKMAESLIVDGKAYVDDTPREQMQKERMDGIESKCRNNMVEENIALWKEMISGSKRGSQCCVRGKLDMQDPNKSLRDPVYYRCNPDPHHRVGSKYKVYPTYDFACPFVDSVEGITHALRSSEYHDRNAQYYRILDDMGLRKVQIYEFSRLNMVYTLLSKRKLLWFVQNGQVEGWDDPRFPTVQGIVRRGLKIEALIQFILQQGASKNINLMEWDKLWLPSRSFLHYFLSSSAMASDPDREAAAFFAHLFRATMSAGDASEDRQIFHPIIIGVLGGALAADDDGSPSLFPPDRILLVHPISRRVSVLRGDPAVFFEMLSGGAGRKMPPPASKASIEAMRTVEGVDEGEECVVCLDELGQAVVKEMPCRHRFHGDCIDKWLGLHGTCPVCRYSMPEEENTAKKVGSDGNGDREGLERAVWFEITFGRGGTEDRDQEPEHLMGEQSVDGNSS